ncbi:NYN domain-containing protein [Ornithinicoccus halotolerans]|uniref:NYN domain-containing protein n=1 Tax=Ornithinicoccus halotolerans TaxID=1748220 RepID=UPI0018861F9C|nr:NYN domain-containing protein [Ornithinicoccus halotolerans]
MELTTDRPTYLLVDGENIDATLGTSILGRRPHPEERPRWDRLLTFVREQWGQQARGLFFLNASQGMPMSFVQALRAMGYQAIPLSGTTEEKVVDIAVQRTLQALRSRAADVMLVSHDGDFREDLAALLDGRQVGLMAFQEFCSSGLAALAERGLQSFDLEHDVAAFTAPLPRLRVIPIDQFDPEQFLV